MRGFRTACVRWALARTSPSPFNVMLSKLQNCRTSTEQLLYRPRRSKHWPLLYTSGNEKLTAIVPLQNWTWSWFENPGKGGGAEREFRTSFAKPSIRALFSRSVTSPAMYRRWPVNKLSNCKHPPLVRWSERPWSVPECPVGGEARRGTCGFATVVVQYLISTITGPFASGKDNERELGNCCWMLGRWAMASGGGS